MKILAKMTPPFFIMRKLGSRIIQRKGLPSLFRKINLLNDGTCLEIGCGDGFALRIIQKSFSPKTLIGIDLNVKILKEAERWIVKEKLSDVIKVVAADGTNLPFKDNYFDAVFMFATLHHIKDWKKVLGEITRVLKGDGYFIFTEPLTELYTTIPFWKKIDNPASLFSEKELKESLEGNYLKILSWRYTGFYKKFLKASIEGIYKKSETKLKRGKKIVEKRI